MHTIVLEKWDFREKPGVIQTIDLKITPTVLGRVGQYLTWGYWPVRRIGTAGDQGGLLPDESIYPHGYKGWCNLTRNRMAGWVFYGMAVLASMNSRDHDGFGAATVDGQTGTKSRRSQITSCSTVDINRIARKIIYHISWIQSTNFHKNVLNSKITHTHTFQIYHENIL